MKIFFAFAFGFLFCLTGCSTRPPEVKDSTPVETTLIPVIPTQTLTEAPAMTATPFPHREITVWALYPEQLTLRQQAGTISEVNYVWYRLGGKGSLTGTNPSPDFVKELQAMNVRVVPAIQNVGFNADYVSYVINEKAVRSQHIQDIVTIVKTENFDGIDIDYEGLHPEDKDNFSLFIEELSASLHGEGKLLSVTVHAKTTDIASWDGPNAQDWRRLGAAADMFKIMTYDFTSAGGNPGPIAPIAWTNDVLAYAALNVAPSKTFVGIPFYGYDYGPSKRSDVSWIVSQSIILEYNAKIQRDENLEAFFTYDMGGLHTVYFNDAAATEGKVKAVFASHPDLKGVAIWVLGGEDPGNWAVLSQNLPKALP